ncbi:MAG: C25 family cysteine peptidase, partial [Candidatus Edwardsbacteria bacterium]
MPQFVPPDSGTYGSSSPYPGKLVEILDDGYMMGFHFVSLKIYPLQYIPVARKLILYTNISFTVDLVPAPNPATPVFRRSKMNQELIEDFIKTAVANPAEVDSFATPPRTLTKLPLIPQKMILTALPSLEGNTVDYIIITNDELAPKFLTLANWLTKKGVPAIVKTTEWIDANYRGCDLQEKIRNFIKDAYSYWGVIWILLGGDTNIVPDRKGFYDSYAGIYGPTDLYYAGLDGNWNANGNSIFGESSDNADYGPDLFVGRAPVNDINQAERFINKIITYEKSPPSDYVTRMLFMGASLGYPPPPGDGWGQLTKEYIGSHYVPSFIDPWELYNPLTGPGWQGDELLNSSSALSRINEGYHIIDHADHAGRYDLGTGLHWAGAYRTINRIDMDGLSNGSQYSILFSLGCSPNAFDYDCISEHFMTAPNGGGVAFIGNSRTGWSSQDYQDKKFFESLFVNGLYHLGMSFASIQYGYSYYRCNMNLLGNPEMPVWKDTPKTFYYVDHPTNITIGPTSFKVTVYDDSGLLKQGALVCLQKGTEAYAYGFTDVNGEVTFDYTPETTGEVNITVTAQNYLPYQGTCTVTPASGAYVCYESHQLNDAEEYTTHGNGDGIANPG